MKKLITLCAVCLSFSAVATTVIFPLQLMTGNKHNRSILIQPDLATNQVVNGTNLVGLMPITVTPTNGIGTATLLPWSYTVRVDGWPKSFHILVPDSTNTLNAVNLITNSVAIGTPIQLLTSVSVSNSASVTWSGNGTSTNPLVATAVAGVSTNLNWNNITNAPTFLQETNPIAKNFLSIIPSPNSPLCISLGSDSFGSSAIDFLPDGAGWTLLSDGDTQTFRIENADGTSFVFYKTGKLTASLFVGSGTGLTFTNAAGSKFRLIVNTSTNGFTFVPAP